MSMWKSLTGSAAGIFFLIILIIFLILLFAMIFLGAVIVIGVIIALVIEFFPVLLIIIGLAIIYFPGWQGMSLRFLILGFIILFIGILMLLWVI